MPSVPSRNDLSSNTEFMKTSRVPVSTSYHNAIGIAKQSVLTKCKKSQIKGTSANSNTKYKHECQSDSRNGNVAENWSFWKQHYLNYIEAAEIKKKTKPRNVLYFYISSNPNLYKIYATFSFAEAEKKKLPPFIQSTSCFVKTTLQIFPNQTIEKFITALRDQVSKCKILKDGLVK